jgi:hypothetical protein
MKNLKNSLFFMACALTFGCQTSKVFEIKTHLDKDGSGRLSDLQVVSINSDRIRHECYFMNAETENNWRHQYFMYILNDKNEVISAMYPTNQDDEDCLSHLKKVEKVFKKVSKVKMCLRGEYKKISELNELYDFGQLGQHKESYSPMNFDSICSEKECYSVNETWTKTCPGFVKHERPVDKTRYKWEDSKTRK